MSGLLPNPDIDCKGLIGGWPRSRFVPSSQRRFPRPSQSGTGVAQTLSSRKNNLNLSSNKAFRQPEVLSLGIISKLLTGTPQT